MAWLRWHTQLACCVLLAVMRVPGRAQEKTGDSEEKLKTLHVYKDLIQVPVLVLDTYGDRMKPIDSAKFLVSLDSGPAFRPRHIRQEGEDPISLAILLDTSEGDVARLMENADLQVANLASGSLDPRDHVSVYGFDCKLIRSLDGTSANPAQLKVGVDVALAPWRTRLMAKSPRCGERISLWDAMRWTVRDMAQLPGRRALLVVTPGTNDVSGSKWNELRSEAQHEGVAVFGLVPSRALNWGREHAFNEICELSGGVLMQVHAAVTREKLAEFVAMLRERYILEFGRAGNETAGVHSMVVSVSGRTAYVRPAGVSVSLPDPAAKADPTTTRESGPDAPEFGVRKVLKPK